MGNKADDERYDRERQSFAQQIEDGTNLERIADALERLVIAADSIATALSLQIICPPHPGIAPLCPDCGAALLKANPARGVLWTDGRGNFSLQETLTCNQRVARDSISEPGASTTPDAGTANPHGLKGGSRG